MTRFLDKTDKGREEIATRKYRLAPRMRTLLVLIDGKHSEDDLVKQVAGLGLNEQSIVELLESGFIEATNTAAAAVAAVVTAEAPVIASPPSEPEPGAPGGLLPPGENQFQALYNFYTSTIKNAIGLRGFGLQLKVERAASIEDFRELRHAYLEAVLKSKGTEMARSLRDRLDQLLFLGHPPESLDPIF